MIPVSYLTNPLLTGGGGGEQGLQAATLQGQGGDRRFRGECATASSRLYCENVCENEIICKTILLC